LQGCQIGSGNPSTVVAGVDHLVELHDIPTANSTDPHVEVTLWGMVQQGGARLDECQQQKLYHLLLTFSDTFTFDSWSHQQTSAHHQGRRHTTDISTSPSERSMQAH